MKSKAISTDENLASYLKWVVLFWFVASGKFQTFKYVQDNITNAYNSREVNTPDEKCIPYDDFVMDGELTEIFSNLESEADIVSSPRRGNKKSKALKSINSMRVLIQNIGELLNL